MSTNLHERARQLIALSGPEISADDQVWLAKHLESCAGCSAFAESSASAIGSLRAIPVAADRTLVTTTQMRVRQRALEWQRRRERRWLVSISCAVVSLLGLVSGIALWRGFEWMAARAQIAASIWQVGFLFFFLMPAMVVAILLLARDTHLADHTGSYEG